MTIRRTAQWQRCLDDRILEHLRDTYWSSPEFMANLPNIHATEAQIRDRCFMLADVELVAFPTEDAEMVELTTRGKQYLEGDVDVELYPRPRHPQLIEI